MIRQLRDRSHDVPGSICISDAHRGRSTIERMPGAVRRRPDWPDADAWPAKAAD